MDSIDPGPSTPPAPGFLAQTEVGASIAARDWSRTPLGPIEDWAPSLRTALSICLGLGDLPTCLYWGADFLSLYNDAYARTLGARHPDALGRPLREVWPEISAILEGQLAAVVSSGRGFAARDQSFDFGGDAGRSPRSWRYSFAPVQGEDGTVVGVLATGIETTAERAAERRQAFRLELEHRLRDLADPDAIMAEAAEALGRHLGVGRCGYGEVDPTGTELIAEHAWTDGVMPPLPGRLRLDDFGPAMMAEFRAGRTVRLADTVNDARTREVAEAYVDIGAMRAGVAIPLMKHDRFVAALYAHQTTPRLWSDEEEALMVDVAERTWSAVDRARIATALRENEARLELVRQAADLGVWDWDVPHGRMVYSERAKAILGLPPGAPVTLEQLQAATHPEDLVRTWPMAMRALDPAIRAREPFEYRIVRPDGEIRWVAASGEAVFAVLDGEARAVRYVGALQDITERKSTEAALRESEARLRALADNIPSAVIYQLTAAEDGRRRFTFVSHSCERITGVPAEAALADATRLYARIHPDYVLAMMAEEARAQAGSGGFSFETPMLGADDIMRWFKIQSAPRLQADGSTVWDGIQIDIDDLKRTEQALKDALDQRAVLFRELSHRVANGFQIMASLLTLQSRRLTDAAAVSALEAAAARVQSMGLVHRRLYAGGTAVGRQDLAAYLSDLMGDLERAHFNRRGRGKLRLDLQPIGDAPTDMAVTVGMIAAELVMNAAKHAVGADEGDGEVTVACRLSGGMIELGVTDNGPGLPEGFDLSRQTGQGMLIASSQAAQLGGSLQVERLARGARFWIRFPAPAD